MIACIGEPISWPRLERYATNRSDRAIAAHLARCAACAQCLTEIASDLVALPPLVVPARANRVCAGGGSPCRRSPPRSP
jgi:hypothetical protein